MRVYELYPSSPSRSAWKLVCLFLIVSSSGLGQNRETLETKVSSKGHLVFLEWTKKHPWDQDLTRRPPSLFVEYHGANGVGIDCLSTHASGSLRGTCNGLPPEPVKTGNRVLSFRLPNALTAEPRGNVCLYFRMPDQRVLPIRRVTKEGENTARFQVPEWTQQMIYLSRRSLIEADRARIDVSIKMQAANISEQKRFVEGKGWHSMEACESLEGGRLQISQDRPVAEPKDQDSIARIVCIMRLKTAETIIESQAKEHLTQNGPLSELAKLLFALRSSNVQPPNTLELLLRLVSASDRQRWLQVRGEQYETLSRDWIRFEPEIAGYRKRFPVPHFESAYLTLKLQTLTQGAARRVFAKLSDRANTIDPQDVLGVMGGSLEAYSRCVEDGRRLLDLNYRQSQELKNITPSLNRRIRDQMRQECRVGVNKLSSMQQRLVELQKELIAADGRLRSIRIGPLSDATQALNGVGCTP